MTWAAISLARHGPLPLPSAVVYVLKDSGPNWAEQLTAWATLGATLGIGLALAGALVARGQLKEAKKDRYSQRIMEMFRAWDEDDLIATRRLLTGLSPDQFKDLYFWERKRNSKQFYEFLKLGNYFEIFGISRRTRRIDHHHDRHRARQYGHFVLEPMEPNRGNRARGPEARGRTAHLLHELGSARGRPRTEACPTGLYRYLGNTSRMVASSGAC